VEAGSAHLSGLDCSLPTCRVDLDNCEFADQNARS
jgi:hypothetical protein